MVYECDSMLGLGLENNDARRTTLAPSCQSGEVTAQIIACGLLLLSTLLYSGYLRHGNSSCCFVRRSGFTGRFSLV